MSRRREWLAVGIGVLAGLEGLSDSIIALDYLVECSSAIDEDRFICYIAYGYQFYPRRRDRIDDVGLGKTVEAGLVMQELIIRHRARRILIVCPAALQIQWRDQMRDKFGLEFRIVDKEVADITSVLRELDQAIRAELEEPEYVQFELFSPLERDQYSRNVAALQVRLAQIPGEIEQEAAIIRARFADPQLRLFPVAVTFLAPEKLAHS